MTENNLTANINSPSALEAPQSKTKIINYINVFRGLAIILIVMGHTMQFGGENSFIHQLNMEIFCGGTALFIFISGFLFQHLSHKYEYKNYMSKKWQNVILPYLFTAIPGLILCFTMPKVYGNAFDGLPILAQIPMMLSIGRVHDVPAWFIPMITIFFVISPVLLFLEKKNILYKLLPLLFLITAFLCRHDVDYNSVLGLSYKEKYLAYLGYVLIGFVHFMSLYVFGMFCSKYKDIIDKFYEKRSVFWLLMLACAVLNIYSSLYFNYSNGTISKIFATVLLLSYLKHYDSWLISRPALNKALDFLAKYSFGLFFIHWYIYFLFNQLFKTPEVPAFKGISTIAFVSFRCIFVVMVSLFVLWAVKSILLKINPNAKTRSFIGV